jgi:hypothetical protein
LLPLQQTLTNGQTPTSGAETASQMYPDGQSDGSVQVMWPLGTLGEKLHAAIVHAKLAATSRRN